MMTPFTCTVKCSYKLINIPSPHLVTFLLVMTAPEISSLCKFRYSVRYYYLYSLSHTLAL